MRLVSQQKGKRPGKGSPWTPTGASIRRATGDTSGGTNPGQTTRTSQRVYGIAHAAPRISAFQNVLKYLSGGFAVDLLVGYGPIGDYKDGSPGFRGNHRIVLVGRNSDKRLLLSADPLYDGRRAGIPRGPAVDTADDHLQRGQCARARSVHGQDRSRRHGLLRPVPDAQHDPASAGGQHPGRQVHALQRGGGCHHRARRHTTRRASASRCTAPQPYPVAPNANVPGGTFRLVKLLEGSRKGWYVNAKYASPV